jgi:hypothetical protein
MIASGSDFAPIAGAIDYVIAVVNLRIWFMNRSLTEPPGMPIAGLFKDQATGQSLIPSGVQLGDPQIIYDRNALRFVLTVVGSNDNNQTSYLFLAASTPGQSPQVGNWNSWRINVNKRTDGTMNPTPRCADRDRLGANEDGVYVTADMYAFSCSGDNHGDFKYAKLWEISDGKINGFSTSLHAYAMSPLKNPDGKHATNVQPGTSVGGLDSEYMVSMWGYSRSPAREYFTFFTVVCCNNDPKVNYIWVDGKFFPPTTNASNGGSSHPPIPIMLDDSDQYRPSQATVSNGLLWTTETIQDPNNSALSSVALFSLSPQQTQAWAGYASVPNSWCYNSAVGVVNSNTEVIAYNVSSNSTPPKIGWRTRRGAYWSSKSTFSNLPYVSNATNRWGDYAGAAGDPDGATVWIFNEYVHATSTLWSTYMAGLQ